MLVLVVLGSVRFRYLWSDMRALLGLLVVTLILSASMLVLALNKQNNLWLSHIDTLIEFCFYVLVFSYWQPSEKVARIFRREFVLFYGFVWLVSKFSIEKLEYFDNFSSGLASVVIMCIACYTIFNMTNLSRIKSFLDYRFLVLSGTLLYHFTKIVIYSSGNLILDLPPSAIIKAWSIHWIATIITYLLYSMAFLLDHGVRRARLA